MAFYLRLPSHKENKQTVPVIKVRMNANTKATALKMQTPPAK
jgi:hypothetical protein